MGNTGITKKQVLEAIERIVATGDKPTAKGIREILGTGSLTTISKHLQFWKEKNPETKEDSDEIKLDALEGIDLPVIAEFLSNEHPQTVALIISFLSPEESAEILEMLEDGLRNDVLDRLSSILYVNPRFLKILNTTLKSELEQVAGSENSNKGGIEYLAKVVKNLKGNSKTKFLNSIKAENPSLAKELKTLEGGI